MRVTPRMEKNLSRLRMKKKVRREWKALEGFVFRAILVFCLPGIQKPAYSTREARQNSKRLL
jgi:hypothetical protein